MKINNKNKTTIWQLDIKKKLWNRKEKKRKIRKEERNISQIFEMSSPYIFLFSVFCVILKI